MKKLLKFIIPAILITSPYLLYGIAQTSRLHAAVETGDINRITRTIKPWKSLNGLDRRGRTPLSIAIKKKNLPVAKFLIESGASIQFTSYSGRKFDYVVKAVDNGQQNFVKLFIDHGAKLKDGLALKRAVQSGNLKMVQRLLEYNAPVNAMLPNGETPLFSGVALSHRVESRTEIVTLLLRNGGAVDVESNDGHTLLFAPMYTRPVPDLEMIELLLRNGFPIRKRNKHGKTQLYYAARAKKIDVVRSLLKHGADANDCGAEYMKETSCRNVHCIRTALHEAVDINNYGEKFAGKSTEIASLLLEHGAKVNVVDCAGNTPLLLSVNSNNFPAAELLLKTGANWEIGRPNRKPMDIAQKKKASRFIDLLTKFKGNQPVLLKNVIIN